MPTAPASLPQGSRAGPAAVALAASLVCGLSACEYQYDGGVPADAPTRTASATDAAIPPDPALNRPVSGAELDTWVAGVLPETAGQVFHVGSGLLDGGVVRTETTRQLPGGTYALTLVCRSTRRVSFTVSDKASALIDLSLRCGSSRVNVVQLAADTVLTVRIESLAPADFAYRVSRL